MYDAEQVFWYPMINQIGRNVMINISDNSTIHQEHRFMLNFQTIDLWRTTKTILKLELRNV